MAIACLHSMRYSCMPHNASYSCTALYTYSNVETWNRIARHARLLARTQRFSRRCSKRVARSPNPDPAQRKPNGAIAAHMGAPHSRTSGRKALITLLVAIERNHQSTINSCIASKRLSL